MSHTYLDVEDWLPTPPLEPCMKVTLQSSDSRSFSAITSVPMLPGIFYRNDGYYDVYRGPVNISAGGFVARALLARPYMGQPWDDFAGGGSRPFTDTGGRADGTGLWINDRTVLSVHNTACTQRLTLKLAADFDMTRWAQGNDLLLGSLPTNFGSQSTCQWQTYGSPVGSDLSNNAGQIVSAAGGIFWIHFHLSFYLKPNAFFD